ncbi:hypothetical protein [Flexivirga caeni]|uniref:Uncharacterized protein n=1 Tax=Flexivirga caeni TaxID=2294115 RepID=A0A3M9M7Q1_9MICO|nr:hypothetical protein [Flexivirga caeni]RNI21542.1 hypothetical protein EFY87_10250 [Flexivirga caeni]
MFWIYFLIVVAVFCGGLIALTAYRRHGMGAIPGLRNDPRDHPSEQQATAMNQIHNRGGGPPPGSPF